MYFTKSQLRSYPSHLEFANESISKNASQNEFDIFLSHSFKDKEYIIKLKQKFESYHHTVYVDWITDSHLSRNNVDKSTAAQIRKRMKQCKCLLFATSENSSDSKWMPWELGYFDGYNGKVAIVPIVESASSDFKGQEYLSLYPYIDEAGIKGSSEKALWVNEENKSCNLRKWIN